MSSLLHPYTPSRLLRSASLNLLSQPRINITLACRCFRHIGPSPWNSLPHHLRSTDSYTVFKSNLKLTFSLVQASLAASNFYLSKPYWLPSRMFHRGQRFVMLWRGTLSYRGLASSSERGRFPSLLHKRGIVFQLTLKRCVLLLHSSALWKLFCSGRHTMFDFLVFTYHFYSQTVPVLSFF